MGILTKFFRIAPKSEWGGISLSEMDAWEVAPTNDAAAFLSALPALMPNDSIIYFEGTTEPDVEAFLDRHAVAKPAKVALGTIWPSPKIFHVPCLPSVIDPLVALVQEHPVASLCFHVHSYQSQQVLLEWHDAFCDDPIRVSRKLPEASVACFAEALGSTYESSSPAQ